MTDRYLNAESVDLVLADDQTNPSSNRVDQTPDTNFGPVWLLTDQVGTARDLVCYSASSGSWLVTHRVFNSFAALEQNVPTTSPQVGTSIAYAGALLDPNTGLQDSWNRWYNPGVGQFISPDPDGLAAGTNPYAYCDDCPLTESDPTGRCGQAITFNDNNPSVYFPATWLTNTANPGILWPARRLRPDVEPLGRFRRHGLAAGAVVVG